MDLSKAKGKADGLLNKCTAALKSVMTALLKACSSLNEKMGPLSDRLFARFPADKRRLMLYAFGGLIVLFLILMTSVLAANAGSPSNNRGSEKASDFYISGEELFIPAEPDFLPEFLLEREPRGYWSLEDIRPYWKNPGNPELWQGELRYAVDMLMDGVP